MMPTRTLRRNCGRIAKPATQSKATISPSDLSQKIGSKTPHPWGGYDLIVATHDRAGQIALLGRYRWQ